MNFKQAESTRIFCDNKSIISLSKNPVLRARNKHIDIKYIRELVNNKEIKLEFCRTEEQKADILTKPLKAMVFHKLSKELV